MNKTIAIDGRMWGARHTGIGNYVQQVASRLFLSMPNVQFTVIGSADLDLKQYPHVSTHLSTVPIYSWREQLGFAWQIHKINADLTWFPHFNVPLLFYKPFVSTIHDLTQLKYQGNKLSKPWHKMAYHQTLRHAISDAAGIISVSQATADDVVDFLPKVNQETLHVIANGVESSQFKSIDPAQVRRFQEQFGNYILICGVWREHKNIANAVRAFNNYCDQGGTNNLVITGRPDPHYPEAMQLIEQSPHHGRIRLPGFVPSQHMPALLSSANSLFFPSLAEGFGLPAIEAMAAGTPVLVSNIPALQETCGDAALYADPHNIEQMAQQLLAIEDQATRVQLVKQGQQQFKKYNWDQCATAHQKVFEEILDC